jgi:peptidoglycan/LPS O-acetylase OafA/YrhL
VIIRDGYRACKNRLPDTRHVDVLDGIRALAIFIVAWYHIWQQSWLWPILRLDVVTGQAQFGLLSLWGNLQLQLNFDPLVRSGYIMVDLMLLISGFLLFLPHARHMVEGERLPGVKDFYLKRAVRILPSYWLSVFVVLFCFALPRQEYPNALALWRDLLSHLTFTHVFWYESYVATSLNVVLWTLAIEVQFYLVFPLLARAFVKKPWLTWAVMAAAGLAFRRFAVAPHADTTLWVNQMPTFLDVYANGMLAAWGYVWLVKRFKHTRATRILCTLAALMLLWPIWQIIRTQAASDGFEAIRINQARHRFAFSALCCLFILASANAGALWRYLLSNRVMRVGAAVSMQFYIWHQFIAVQLRRWRFPPSQALLPNEAGEQPWQWYFTLCAFGIPLVLSLLLTYGFERPIARAVLAWYKRRAAGRVENKQKRVEETA